MKSAAASANSLTTQQITRQAQRLKKHKTKSPPTKRLDGQTIFLVLALCVATGLIGIALAGWPSNIHTNADGSVVTPARQIPINGDRAYQYLTELCRLGSRATGSPGMIEQQDLLIAHFQGLGGEVLTQTFPYRHPQNGSRVDVKNLIIQWHPQRTERILLCAHYDTRPYPDRDPDPTKRRGVFVGANDGASGVAVLMELGHHIKSLDTKYGVDFVLFDAEELVYDDQRDPYFVGSKFFAESYVKSPPPHTYKWGVLLDMVGDSNLEIYYEANSVKWRDTRPLVKDIWKTAKKLGVREFIPRVGHTIRDDHLMLHEIAKIPTCDIIDFDYPSRGRRNESYWHTTQDTSDKCSATSLRKVGWVVLEWLKQVK